jgi:hypothetical protein
VLPNPAVEQVLGAAGLDMLAPLTVAGRLIASGGAALIGGLLGLALATLLARRGHDPRPVYAEPQVQSDYPLAEEPVRRPLRVREELSEGFADPLSEGATPSGEGDSSARPDASGVIEAPFFRAPTQREEGFMILTPQPVHPPRPAPDLDRLIEQFDHALAAFHSGDEPSPEPVSGAHDPVHAFVARQTGSPAPSPLGGRIPDNQAELRAALDKLARAQRKND